MAQHLRRKGAPFAARCTLTACPGRVALTSTRRRATAAVRIGAGRQASEWGGGGPRLQAREPGGGGICVLARGLAARGLPQAHSERAEEARARGREPALARSVGLRAQPALERALLRRPFRAPPRRAAAGERCRRGAVPLAVEKQLGEARVPAPGVAVERHAQRFEPCTPRARLRRGRRVAGERPALAAQPCLGRAVHESRGSECGGPAGPRAIGVGAGNGHREGRVRGVRGAFRRCVSVRALESLQARTLRQG